jgi:hypothetical protein
LDPIQKRYQLTVLFQYSDIRLVHLPARKLSNIDIAFIRVYEQGTPLSTPQYLTANIKLPQKEEPIAVLGFPQQSHRYPHPKEWMHLLQNEYPYIAMGTENFLSILQPFLLQRSPQSKAHLLYAMMQETKENTKILSDLFSTEAPDTLIKQREQSFLEWTTKKSERKPYAQAYYAYEVLIAQQQSFAKDAIRLRWYSLASDLIFSARRRYGWRYNRPFPDANRIIGYKNNDNESIILHLEQLSSHLDEALDHKLLLYLFQQHPLPPVSSFLQGFTVVDSALIFLEDHKTELLHVQKSILQLDIRTPVPDNPWIDLGASLEQISFEIRKRDARIKYSLRKKHRIFMEGMSIFLSDSFYPDADGSLRVSFGRIQQNWMSDIFSFEEQNHHISSFVPKYLNWFPYFISNVDATPGSSGSPTINIHGEWIGILFGGNNTRHTSAWFHAKHTENRHISTQSIFWYLSLNPIWNNLLDELQP